MRCFNEVAVGRTTPMRSADIISEVVAIDGTIDLELDVNLDKAGSTPNYRDVRLTAVLVASDPKLTVSWFPFPLNLVINLILKFIAQGFGRRTVAEYIAHLQLPLLLTEEAFQGSGIVPWIARHHLTTESQLIGLGYD